MADIAQDLKELLQGTTAAGDQVYYDRAPQGAQPPYLVITEAEGGLETDTLEGYPGPVESVWHIYSYGVTRISANDLASAVRDQLLPISGKSIGGSLVDSITSVNYRDTDVDDSKDGDYAVRYWTRKVYSIWLQLDFV
jgi:hypothetical protein